MSIGPVAPNSDLWTPFRIGDQIMVGGYGGDLSGALVCARYTTETVVRNVRMKDPMGRDYIGREEIAVTNWLDMFVLTNYPDARFRGIIGRGLNSGFEAVRLWDVEVKLPVNCPILDWSRLPPPRTNTAGIPVGWILQTAPLYDYGLRCPPPRSTDIPAVKSKDPPDNGNPEYRLGMDYLNGVGRTNDPVMARDWFIKAAKKGHTEAMEQLRTNANLTFVEWRGTNQTRFQPPPPATDEPASSKTNQDEPPPPTPPDETPSATSMPPSAPPATNGEAAILAQLKAANSALEKRVAELEGQPPKHPPSETQPGTSSGNWRWYLVLGILLVIGTLWFFSVSRREPE